MLGLDTDQDDFLDLEEISKICDLDFLHSSQFKINVALNLFRKQASSDGTINFQQFKSVIKDFENLLDIHLSIDETKFKTVYQKISKTGN